MPLSLQTRTIGDVVVISCSGRIVEGAETDALHRQVREMLPLYQFFVLDLHEVSFIDSAGLGLLVRLLARVRAAAGDLRLCGVGPNIEKALKVSRLNTVLVGYETENDAIAAFYQLDSGSDLPARAAVDVLCVHSSSDVLAYLRELLRQAGYGVMTTDNMPDAVTLLRATNAKVVVVESALRTRSAPGTVEVFDETARRSRIVNLPPTFSTDDAGEAGPRLLAQLQH